MKKIISNLLSYSMIELINKSTPFVLLPILTAYLTVEEYGRLSLFQLVLGGGAIFFSLGMTSIVSVDYHKNTELRRAEQLEHIIKLCITSFFLVLPLIIGVSVFINDYFLILVFLGALGTAVSNYFLAYLQVSRSIKVYALLSLSQTLLNFLLTILLITYFFLGYQGRLFALSIPPILISIFFYYYFFHKKEIKNKLTTSVTIKRALPLFFHQVSNWSRYSIDKLVLFYFLGETALGNYNINFQLAFILSVLVMVINKTFQPYVLKGLSRGESTTRLLFGQLSLVILSSIFIMILIILFGDILLGENFKVDADIIIILGVAFFLQGCYLCLCNYLYFYERGVDLAKNSTYCLIFTFVSSIPLVTNYGGLGAALSILISMSILLLGTLKNFVELKKSL